jgi:hypothetical protein
VTVEVPAENVRFVCVTNVQTVVAVPVTLMLDAPSVSVRVFALLLENSPHAHAYPFVLIEPTVKVTVTVASVWNGVATALPFAWVQPPPTPLNAIAQGKLTPAKS